MHGSDKPSDWVRRWSTLIAPRSTVLDVACGAGRHLRWLHGLGHAVVGVDRSPEAVAAGALLGEMVCADIENGPWPFAGRQFGAVVVTNYLWRPLFPTLVASLAPGGVLVYETFAHGNETVGRPARPEFLLQPGELLAACSGLRTVAYEDGFLEEPARFVQRITAIRELADAGAPSRHLLASAAS
ncbi:class I SAM-dependent methyltransferase [Acidovorax sp. LjRoot118]|uniref:class I SAM-dependent methyltransferase n=1 Tax=unclassified Acidovorax TaxID=2684926 RepID=UPI00070EFE4C|nr:class I SAM-dependent methyltransferase [Acidovorax sp. Root217]KRC23873.1 SAM-dependent methyltransferase [Acidovorax sp. Root217]